MVDRDTTPDPVHWLTSWHPHGTRCAGVIAMKANNSFCGVGIAPSVTLGGNDYRHNFLLLIERHIDVQLITSTSFQRYDYLDQGKLKNLQWEKLLHSKLMK